MRWRDSIVRSSVMVAGLALAAALLALGYGLFTLKSTSAAASVVATSPARAAVDTSRMAATSSVAEEVTASPAPTTGSVVASSQVLLSASLPPSAPGKSVVGRPLGEQTVPAGQLDAYGGLGSWVDIYDAKAWRDPAGTVSDMASHGVRTLFIETGNSKAKSALTDPGALQVFIRECHARNMRIVAWYLPDLRAVSRDFSRIEQAIDFRTSDGQKFDSFALDVESTAVSSESVRNRSLAALTQKIRGLVGPSYTLGAIIPSPVGLNKKAGYWDAFPYTTLAGSYDVFVPMGYYTYHGKTAAQARSDTLANVRILRAQRGCASVPIHLIGGISDDSSTSEVQAFVSAIRETQCFGGSLYGWVGTTAAHWRALQSIGR